MVKIYLFIYLFGYLIIYLLIYLSEFGRGYEWLPKYVVCHQGDTIEVCLSAKDLGMCLDHVLEEIKTFLSEYSSAN